MTPLAASIAKQLTLPAGSKDHNARLDIRWNANLLKAFKGEVHYFECSQAVPLAAELARSVAGIGSEQKKEDVFKGRVFLPAPKTWIEAKDKDGTRFAVLLEDTFDGWAKVYYFSPFNHFTMGRLSTDSSDFERFSFKIVVLEGQSDTKAHIKFVDNMMSFSHFMLMVINTPKIIGRRQVMPNRALERRLTRNFAKGTFPLLAWTEIELKVAKPVEIDDGEPHEAHLTGRRALHFCRAHLRVRNGALEYVSSHWRGDPSIGIKQSRYRLTA
jgi:hypothetical protein